MDERPGTMAEIHPTAIVERGAELGAGVRIGPYCLVGPKVRLGDGVELVGHVVVAGDTSIGAGTRVFPFASLGHPPQDLKYRGEETRLEIGERNTIREHVTMNPGTAGGGGVTRVGSGGLFMIGTHVAHDCRVGDGVVMANNATLGGHVQIGDHVVMGGLCAAHQYVRVGPHAMVAGLAGLDADVIPYGTVRGAPAALIGLNIVGMKRRGFAKQDIQALRTAYRLLFAHEGTMAERLEDVAALYPDHAAVKAIVEFIRSADARALAQPHPER
jgi:UDP-N-acetylglucosamine acyltransferase